jgi:Ca2+-binding EF-hand superfamily protein
MTSTYLIASSPNPKFETLDTNADGVISNTEFISGASDRFSKMDANDDGEITPREYKKSNRKKPKKKPRSRSNRGACCTSHKTG